jgi:hypothetical protein
VFRTTHPDDDLHLGFRQHGSKSLTPGRAKSSLPRPGHLTTKVDVCVLSALGGSLRREVERMVSARMKLALLAIGSVVAAALVGGCPWGP